MAGIEMVRCVQKNAVILKGRLAVIVIRGLDFQLSIELDEGKSLKDAKIECEWRLQHILQGYGSLLQQRLRQSPSLAAFLLELKSILERQLQGRPEVHTVQPPDYYEDLIQQISSLGWDRLVYIDALFQQMHLQANDRANRPHVLKIHLHSKHPDVSPTCSADLPGPFDPVWRKDDTLGKLLQQFETQLDQYQEFWDMMDEVDKQTWVLEPEKPTRCAAWRRIALGKKASVRVEVDPKHSRLLPECRFLGPDHVVNPLRENLHNNLDKWQPGATLLNNLQSILGTNFPTPSNTKKEDFSMECGICYAYRLDNQIPDQVCDDPRCGQTFHHNCLYQWLRGLPSSRQSFNTVFGECPYCSKPITVKMP